MSDTQNNSQAGFKALSLSPQLLSVLDRLQYTEPTPIQHLAIPHALEGRDVTGIAQTGTGKTLAFGLPILERLRNNPGVALILAPTRELALQIDETFQKVGRQLGFRTAVLIGGAPMGRQISQLRQGPHAIIATPGRLKDHLSQRTVNLGEVTIVVLDEADRMLDMGFAPVIKEILRHVPKERQTLLFSATMPKEIEEIANSAMNNPGFAGTLCCSPRGQGSAAYQAAERQPRNSSCILTNSARRPQGRSTCAPDGTHLS